MRLRVPTKFLRQRGPARVKRYIWDREFRSGKWDYIRDRRESAFYEVLERFANGGNILDLGCGSGRTALQTDPKAFGIYVGVDVSAQAIAEAMERLAGAPAADRIHFVCHDVATYEPQRSFRTIVFRESLYYFPPSRIDALLRRLASHVEPGGVFIVRVYDANAHAAIVGLLRDFEVVEEHAAGSESGVLVVFRVPAHH